MVLWRSQVSKCSRMTRWRGKVGKKHKEKIMTEEKGQEEQLHGDPRYHAVLREMAETHSRKSQDYGSDGSPLDNLRAVEGLGFPRGSAA